MRRSPIPENTSELIDRQCGESVYDRSLAQHHDVEKSAAPRPAGGRTEFRTGLSQRLAELAGIFGWKWPATHARRIRLGDSQYAIDAGGPNAGAGAYGTRNAIRRGHVGIGAVIDIEEGALRALEENVLACAQRFFERVDRVIHIRLELSPPRDRLLAECIDVDWLPVVVLDELEVLLLRDARQ